MQQQTEKVRICHTCKKELPEHHFSEHHLRDGFVRYSRYCFDCQDYFGGVRMHRYYYEYLKNEHLETEDYQPFENLPEKIKNAWIYVYKMSQ